MTTDRSLVEADLRLKDAAITHSLNAIAIGDLDGKLVYVNPAFLRLWGYEHEDQVLGRSAIEFWAQPEEAAQVVAALMSDGQWRGEMRARRHGGGEFVASLLGVLLRDAQDRPAHILGTFLDVTERYHAQQEVEENVARLKEAQRIAHIGSWELDLVSNELHWSDEIFRIFEIDPTRFDASYEAFLNAIHPDDREKVNQAYRDSLANHTPYEITHRLKMPDGRIKYVNERCESFFDATGKPLQSKGTVQDVTKQVKVELELKALTATLEERVEARTDELEAERNFINTVLDTAGALVMVLDTHGHIVRFNRACEEMTGFTSEELHDTPIWETLIPIEQQDEVQRVFQALKATAQPSQHENNWLTKDGRQRLIAWSNSVIKDEHGRTAYIIGTGIDITARKQAEQALAESEGNLRQAQEIAHMGHWRANLQTGELQWSDEIFNIFGRNKADFAPTVDNFFACVHPDDIPAIEESERQAFVPGGKHSIDHRIVLPDGDIRWVHEEAVVDFDAEGQPLYLTGTVHDITDRKQTELQLTAAKEEAERANHAKSDFLSRMSHELRTPLNAILGFAQVLEMEQPSVEQQECIQEIVLAGNHLLELINELLDMSRIETGRLVVMLETTALEDIVQQALILVEPLVAQNQLSLINHCRNGFQVATDKTRLRQILVNLLSNAAKYNRRGGSITLDCQPVADDRLRLSVTDTGMGISEERMPDLFVPFERLGAEHSGIDGTGIGLALAKQLMELLGGYIGVDSVPGQGSTFWIEIPLGQAAEPDIGVQALPASDRQTDPSVVLYVEDNAANLRVVEAVFRRYPQMKLLSAMNGEKGLELARQFHPDVILLDINLPGMNGFDVLRELKQRPDTRDIPLIALSADAMPFDVERGLEAGFRRYLTKPVKIDELLQALREEVGALRD